MKRIQQFILMLLFSSLTLVCFAQEQEADKEPGFALKPEIMIGWGVTLASSMETSFPEQRNQDIINGGVWHTEGAAGLNFTLGFRLNFYFNRNFNLLVGADYLYLKTGYNITDTKYADSQYRFTQSSFFVPFELLVGERFMFTVGGFLNYMINAPSWNDVSGESSNAYAESGTIEEKYYHPTSYGFSVGFRINFKDFISIYAQYRHGITPWLETPFEKAYIRSITSGVTFTFNN